MSSAPTILIAYDDAWDIVESSGATARVAVQSDMQAFAQALARTTKNASATTLLVPAHWCLAASVTASAKSGSAAWRYALEESLPLAAEEVAADFVGRGPTRLGVAIAATRLRAMLVALEEAGVSIEAISPAVIVAAQGEADGEHVLIEGEWTSSVRVRGGEIVQWRASRSINDANADTHPSDATAIGVRKLREGVTPLIDLRRGPLAPADAWRRKRKVAHRALVTACVAALAIAGGLIARSIRYDRAADADTRELAAMFHQQFPTWEMPPNVRATLEAEARKTGGGSDAAPVAARRSAAATLRVVLGAVPSNVGVRVGKMSFADDSFEIEATLPQAEQADTIAAAVRAAGVEVQPPQVHRLGDGSWALTLRGGGAGGSTTPVLAAVVEAAGDSSCRVGFIPPRTFQGIRGAINPNLRIGLDCVDENLVAMRNSHAIGEVP